MPAISRMVAYGGAGPLHATAVAREIGIRRVIIPLAPGHFSAYRHAVHAICATTLCAPGSRSSTRSSFDEFESDLSPSWSRKAAQPIAASAGASRARSRVKRARSTCAMSARSTPSPSTSRRDVRQAPGPRRASRRCSMQVHEQRYGTSAPGERAEIASLRTTVTGVMQKPRIGRHRQGAMRRRRKSADTGKRQAVLQREPAASSTRRPSPAPNCWPAIASPVRR